MVDVAVVIGALVSRDLFEDDGWVGEWCNVDCDGLGGGDCREGIGGFEEELLTIAVEDNGDDDDGDDDDDEHVFAVAPRVVADKPGSF